MTTVAVDLLTDQGNGAVVRLPERQFPGVLVQGDTLSNYLTALGEAVDALQRGDVPAAESIVRDLRHDLETLRERYEAALNKNGIPLPY